MAVKTKTVFCALLVLFFMPSLLFATEPLDVSVEDYIFVQEGQENVPLTLKNVTENVIGFSWKEIDSEGTYNWYKFRLNDEPWHVVDKNVTAVVFSLPNGMTLSDIVFQLKGSVDGKKWTTRYTTEDPKHKYDEANMDREGWVIKAGAYASWPYFVAFFTPQKGTVKYKTPRQLTKDDLKISFSGEFGASYETKEGNGFGFNVRFTYTPTHKNDPYTVTTLELSYTRLLYRAKRYNGFQLWLESGIGPSLCLFQETGCFGLSVRLGLSARYSLTDNFVLWTDVDTSVAIEPNFNDQDQLTLGTTFYLTLPVKIGVAYSFKNVVD